MKPTVHKIATLKGHSGAVYSLSEGLAQYTVLSASGDQFVAQWNLRTQQPDNFSLKLPSVVLSIYYCKELSLLFIGTFEGSLHVIDIEAKKEIKYLQLKCGGIFSIVCNFNHNQIILSTAAGHLIALSADNFQLNYNVKLSALKLRNIQPNEEGDKLYVTDGNGELHLVNALSGSVIHSFVANKMSCNVVAIHPSENILITGGRDAHLNFFDAKSYQLIRSVPAHNYAIYDIKFLTGTDYFTTASRDKTIKLWSARSLDFLLRINKEEFDGHINSVNALYWNQELHTLVSAGDDRTLMLWKVE